MKLIEYQGKKLYQDFDIPTTDFIFLEADLSEQDFEDQIAQIEADDLVLKTQVLSGKRGKRGGVKIVGRDEAYRAYQELMDLELGEKIFGILVEEKLQIEDEYYLSINFDRGSKKFKVIFSAEGGVEIESVDHNKIHQCDFEDLNTDFYSNVESVADKAEELLKITQKLYKLAKENDTQLVEINPLVINGKDELVAADAKLVIDDNARFRHSDIIDYERKSGQTEAEELANKYGVAFVELDGEVGIIGNGAGLTMATLDFVELIIDKKPANFLDIGGGANSTKVLCSLEIVKELEPKVIWLNIFGGITSCLEVAKGVIEFKDKYRDYEGPIVVRVMGTDQSKAVELLEEHEIPCYKTMEESAQYIKQQCA